MGYPLGKAPLEDGTGTSPADMQRIIGSLYHNAGIIPGSTVGDVEGATAMSYKVTPCTVFMWSNYASRLGMLVPVDATTIVTDPAPSTGSRTDTVYVDVSGAVRVQKGGSAPSGVTLGRFEVPAGATSTKSLPNIFDRVFAVPAGAALGRLHRFHDPANGTFGNVAPIKLGSGRFTLPSDRIVNVKMTWTASAEPAGSDQRTWGVARWFVYVKGPTTTSFAINWHYEGVHPNTQHTEISLNLAEGDYEIYYMQERMGGARFRHHKGGPDGWLGNRFEVWDAGVDRSGYTS